jgi:hypothetical protein
MATGDIQTLILLVIPVLLIQLGLVIFSLVDLAKRSHVRGSRLIWTIALVITGFTVPTGIIVAAIYLTWGRRVGENDDQC